MRMLAHLAFSELSGCATWRSKAIMRNSFSNTALNETSLSRLRMSRGGTWQSRPLDRIDLNENRILRVTFPHQRRDRRIAGIAAVPIAFAIDLDRLKQRGEARRRKQHVRRDLAVSKDPATPGAHIGCGDEELDRRLRQSSEIDAFGKDVTQGICAAWAKIVGREHARHQVHREEDRRMVVQRPSRMSSGVRRSGLSTAALDTRRQK